MKLVVSKIDKFDNEAAFEDALIAIQSFDPERYKKISRIKPLPEKKRVLAAGMLVNKMCEDLAISDPQINVDDHGKPYLNGHPDIFFNLSHSGQYAAIVYGDRPIGIDIQEHKDLNESLAKRIMNEAELSAYAKDAAITCRLWTVKEAYSKFLGIGLSYDFTNCKVDFCRKIITDTTGRFRDCEFREYMIDSSKDDFDSSNLYYCAVCF